MLRWVSLLLTVAGVLIITAGISQSTLQVWPDGGACTQVVALRVASVHQTNDTYVKLIGSSSSGSSTTTSHAASSYFTVPVRSVATQLSVDVSAAAGAGDSWDITIVDDSGNTSVTCQIAGATATTCTDSSNSAILPAGDAITVFVNPTTPGSTVSLRASFILVG